MSDLLTHAKANDRAVKLESYAGSEGCGDLWVKMLEPDAYGTYLRMSLDWLEKSAESQRPERIDLATWRQAMQEQKDSWTKSISGESSKRGPTIGSRLWLEHLPLVKRASDDHTMFCIGPVLLVKSDVVNTKPASVPKSLLTDAKARIKEMAPLGKLRFELHIFRGKLKSISLPENE